jgi:hypothetical protein
MLRFKIPRQLAAGRLLVKTTIFHPIEDTGQTIKTPPVLAEGLYINNRLSGVIKSVKNYFAFFS